MVIGVRGPALAGAAFAAVLFGGSIAVADALPQISVGRVTTLPPLDPKADVAAWSGTTSAAVTWDVQRGRPMTQPAAVHVTSDGSSLFVRFDVAQREPIVQTQRTNDTGQGTDDSVWVDVWPTGLSGYQYQFAATPNGTHYQTSTENAIYAPRWESYGATTDAGYTVTMKIPLDVMRGARSSPMWNVQFVRYLRATGEQAVWSFDAAQTSPDDPARAGAMQVPAAAAAGLRPRLSTYLLGAAASQSAGGSTSRAGVDLSYPISAKMTFYATAHPDYSNVELDQQTITPSVYPRALAEVRPFFTQGSNNFNQFYCNFCNGFTALYTPAIPTPHAGYALEGKAGQLSFTAFDAEGTQRTDRAAGVVYTSQDQRWTASLNRVQVDTPDGFDVETVAGAFYSDLKRWTLYANYSNDAGTSVAPGNRAQYYDTGATWASQNFAVWGGIHRIGSSFNPADGFLLFPDANGWGLYANKIWTPSASSWIAAYSLGGIVQRNHADDGELNHSVTRLDLDLLTRSAIDLNLLFGSSYLRLSNGVFTPITQNGVSLRYHSGLQTNNPISFDTHGASATPTALSFNTGRYGDGTLQTWTRTSTMRLGSRGTLNLALNDTAQYFSAAPARIQWFERVGYTHQLSSESSFSLGVRRIVGTPPRPSGSGNCIGTCSNLSAAYYLRLRHSELYLAYGDPNALLTAPQLILKLILYAGTDKGT